MASKAFVEEVGTFRQAEWKPDCSMLAIMVSFACLFCLFMFELIRYSLLLKIDDLIDSMTLIFWQLVQ